MAVAAAVPEPASQPLSSSGPAARIDRAALAHNLAQVRRIVGPRTDVLAMVKSDAYGHGGPLVARALAAAGCRSFGVATVAEAAEVGATLRAASAGPVRIVVFGGLLPEEAVAVLEAGAEAVTQEIEVVRALGAAAAAAGTEARIHLKLDTGMHRLGIAPADAVEFAREASRVAGVQLVAACSHFAQAESVTGDVTAGQLEAMLGATAALRDAGFAMERHLANSAGILTRPDTHLDAVRPGIMLYGVAPDRALAGLADLRPVMRLVARVMRVADVSQGEGIGYGHTYRAGSRMRVATLRCGYADGYARCLGNRGRAAVRGVLVPVVGRVCMDHLMLDVTDVPGVALGDEAVLWGDAPGVDEVAEQAGTIAYEMLARVAKRVRREEA